MCGINSWHIIKTAVDILGILLINCQMNSFPKGRSAVSHVRLYCTQCYAYGHAPRRRAAARRTRRCLRAWRARWRGRCAAADAHPARPAPPAGRSWRALRSATHAHTFTSCTQQSTTIKNSLTHWIRVQAHHVISDIINQPNSFVNIYITLFCSVQPKLKPIINQQSPQTLTTS